MSGRRRILTVTIGLLLATLAWQPGLSHGPTLPFAKLADQADLVILGRVESSESRWFGGHIVTTSQVEVLDRYKGRVGRGRIIEVTFVGGTFGNVRETVHYGPELQDGETSVLFLKRTRRLVGLRVPRYLRLLPGPGRVIILRPGEALSRLDHNVRLRRGLNEIAAQVRGRP